MLNTSRISLCKYVFLLVILFPILGNSTETLKSTIEAKYSLDYPERYKAVRKVLAEHVFQSRLAGDEAFIEYVEIEHKVLEKSGEHPLLLCEIKNDLALTYSYMDRRDLSSILALEISTLADELGDDSPKWQEVKALSLSLVAKNYRWDYLYDDALKYQKEAVELMRNAKNPKLLGRALGDLGIIISEMGDSRKAIELYDEALVLGIQTQDTSWILRQQFCKVSDAIILEELDLAKSILLKIIPEMKSYNHSNYFSSIRTLGEVELELENFKDAKFWLDSTATLLKSGANWHSKSLLSKQYTKYYTAVGDFESALDARTKQMAAVDSLYKSLLEDKRIEADANFEKQLKEKEIEELKLKSELDKANLRNWIFGLSGVFIFSTGMLSFWFYNQRQNQRQAFLLSKKEIESQDVRQKLLTSITHELRTPLAVIIGKLQNLQKSNLNIKDATNVVTANQNADHLIKQIDQLLEWNKVEANALELYPSLGSVQEVLLEIIENLKPYAANKNINWNVSIADENFNGNLDFGKFKTIATNLISNAIKYSPASKNVGVRLALKSKQLVLEVFDQGPGIPENQKEKIFDWYYRVANAESNTQYEGFGIGLALSNQLAKLMKGSIDVDTNMGVGSTFRLILPFTPRVKESGSHVDDKNKLITSNFSPNKKEKLSILIIEDHEDLSEHIESLFSEKFEVHRAMDMTSAKTLATTLIPDCIISDIMLPDGSGLELCKKLKAHLLTNHIPIVMLTARTDEKAKFTGLKYRADAFLTKPFNNEELKLTVNGLLQNRNVLKLRYDQSARIESTIKDPFVIKVEEILEKNLGDSNFGADQFAAAMSWKKHIYY